MRPHETKKLLYSKEYHHDGKEEEWEQRFTRFTSERGLLSRIYKAPRKQSQYKWGLDKIQFSEEEIQITTKCIL